MVGKPLWWALQQLSIVNPDDALSGHSGDVERWKQVKGDYVVLGLVEKAAEGTIRKQQTKAGLSLADSLYKLDGFKREFSRTALAGVVLSDLDLRIVLKFLERDRKVVITKGEVSGMFDRLIQSLIAVRSSNLWILTMTLPLKSQR